MSTNRSRRELVKLAAAGGAGALLGGASPVQAAEKLPMITHYRSATLLSKSNLVTYPKIDRPERSYHILYKVELPVLQEGDIVQVGAEVEVTSENKYAVGIASFVSLGKPTDIDGDMAYRRGRFVCYAAGSNLISNVHHHLFFTRVGSLEIDKITAGLSTVFFVSYSASDARKPGDEVRVMDKSGHLSVTLIRPNAA
jgi:hypothetical protein